MEMRAPVTDSEGPFCLLIAPSRELAQQTHEVVEYVVMGESWGIRPPGFSDIMHPT